jgi:TrkA domain protein
VDVEVTPLPGIGTREDFALRDGRRIGVVTHRDGKFDLIVSRMDDPDACMASIVLSPEEASTLAGLLGAPHLVAQLNEQQREISGVTTQQLRTTAYAGRTLGDTAMRTRTGVSIVAVVRSGVAHPSPGPEFRFAEGDVAVVVGTTDGLDEAARILTGV